MLVSFVLQLIHIRLTDTLIEGVQRKCHSPGERRGVRQMLVSFVLQLIYIRLTDTLIDSVQRKCHSPIIKTEWHSETELVPIFACTVCMYQIGDFDQSILILPL